MAKAWAAGRTVAPSVYPHPIAFNILPSVGSFKDDSGESTEEIKMRKETHKILGDSSIRVSSTCARVPVFNGHSIAVHAEFKKPLSVEAARAAISASEGVTLTDDPKKAVYPQPIAASGNLNVLAGRIRLDPGAESNGLALWVSGDNIWKGAAQNAIQIAQIMVRDGMK